MSNRNPLKVVTGVVRGSYVSVLEPKDFGDGQDPKYSMALLIPKSDNATLRKIKAAQKAALEAKKNIFKGGKIPANWKDTLRDGDNDASIDVDENPEYADHYFMNVSSKSKPGVVDRDLNPILDASEIYSGAYYRVAMTAFAFNNNGNQGVSFALNNVQKVKDGEPFGGVNAKAEDDFDDDFEFSADDDDLI